MNNIIDKHDILNKNKIVRQSYKKVAEERLGETRLNNMGSSMCIIKYINYSNIIVQFKNGYIDQTTYGNFIHGSVKNPYDISVYNVGYIGIGNYSTSKNGDHTKQYDYWNQMLRRCYDKQFQERQPTYKGCIVSEEWHNFQNFAKWFDENYYEIEGEKISLDKDLLKQNNKIYSPNTCCFLPQGINVSLVSSKNKDIVKLQAEKYKNYIPKEVYQALLEYKI